MFDYFGICFLLAFLLCIPGCNGLDCFKCDSVLSVRDCMQQDPQTCGWGQICFTTVSRAGFGGKKYTKGCMDDDQCYSLQTLNHKDFCDREPAICVYCCESELCNTAVTSYPIGVVLCVLTSLFVLMVSR